MYAGVYACVRVIIVSSIDAMKVYIHTLSSPYLLTIETIWNEAYCASNRFIFDSTDSRSGRKVESQSRINQKYSLQLQKLVREKNCLYDERKVNT